MAEETLELSTANERRSISINGKLYEIVDKAFVPFGRYVEMRETTVNLEKLFDDKLNAEQADALSKSLERCIKFIAPSIPAEVLSCLADWQRISILRAFLKVPGTTPSQEPVGQA